MFTKLNDKMVYVYCWLTFVPEQSEGGSGIVIVALALLVIVCLLLAAGIIKINDGDVKCNPSAKGCKWPF